jgi:hypothetical protein
MQEEQAILGTHAFTLVNSLVDPLPTSVIPAPLDNMRVAVVSTDMGLQWGGNPYESGDGWPGETPTGCGSVGDNGEFETYSSGKTLYLQDEIIPCDEDASQCPDTWECVDIGENGVGVCDADGDTMYACPGMSSTWLETPIDDEPNPDLTGQVACLTSLGTNGCGFEQQLQAGAVALHREDQEAFMREGSLLAVVVVSDEEDCSIESNGLFGVDEIQNLADGRVNVACGEHPEYLYDATAYKTTFENAKGGMPNAVLFAAIVGVPMEHDCQGRGSEIDDCLDHPDMQLEVIQENDAYFYSPACVRWEGDEQVTKARPGRRFVELAQEFGENGYVFSICNADWTDAMEDIARVIIDELTD